MAPVLVTLNDLEGHFPRSFPLAGLFTNHICAAFYQISTDSALARSLSDSWASCITTLRSASAVCAMAQCLSVCVSVHHKSVFC